MTKNDKVKIFLNMLNHQANIGLIRNEYPEVFEKSVLLSGDLEFSEFYEELIINNSTHKIKEICKEILKKHDDLFLLDLIAEKQNQLEEELFALDCLRGI